MKPASRGLPGARFVPRWSKQAGVDEAGLIGGPVSVHKAPMAGGTGEGRGEGRAIGRHVGRVLPGGRGRWAIALPMAMLTGCITVNAPEDPIVIELNINITQEVIYRLAEDVRDNIAENPEIF